MRWFFTSWCLVFVSILYIEKHELKEVCDDIRAALSVISRTQTENFLRLRYGKMWHLNEDYPYSYKRHGENKAQFGILGSTH